MGKFPIHLCISFSFITLQTLALNTDLLKIRCALSEVYNEFTNASLNRAILPLQLSYPEISYTDRRCFQALHTSKLAPAPCNLPSICGSASWITLDTTLFGLVSEVGLCYSRSLQHPIFSTGMPYYSYASTSSKLHPRKHSNFDAFSLSDGASDIIANLYSVANPDGSYTYYSRMCIDTLSNYPADSSPAGFLTRVEQHSICFDSPDSTNMGQFCDPIITSFEPQMLTLARLIGPIVEVDRFYRVGDRYIPQYKTCGGPTPPVGHCDVYFMAHKDDYLGFTDGMLTVCDSQPVLNHCIDAESVYVDPISSAITSLAKWYVDVLREIIKVLMPIVKSTVLALLGPTFEIFSLPGVFESLFVLLISYLVTTKLVLSIIITLIFFSLYLLRFL